MPPGLPTFAQPEEVQSSDVSMIDQRYSDEKIPMKLQVIT